MSHTAFTAGIIVNRSIVDNSKHLIDNKPRHTEMGIDTYEKCAFSNNNFRGTNYISQRNNCQNLSTLN